MHPTLLRCHVDVWGDFLHTSLKIWQCRFIIKVMLGKAIIIVLDRAFLEHGKSEKILATLAYKQLNQTFESRSVHIPTKMRLFNSHIERMFLYNSEL